MIRLREYQRQRLQYDLMARLATPAVILPQPKIVTRCMTR